MDTNTQEIRTAINWLDRGDMVAILEGIGIASYDSEPLEFLAEAIFENVMDGTLSPDDIDN